MDNFDNSLNNLIAMLNKVPNKEQTLEAFIEQIYANNLKKCQDETEKSIEMEIKQTKMLLQNIKEKICQEKIK